MPVSVLVRSRKSFASIETDKTEHAGLFNHRLHRFQRSEATGLAGNETRIHLEKNANG